MESRIQHVLLGIGKLSYLPLVLVTQPVSAEVGSVYRTKANDINTEFFEFGLKTGFINIDDFTSEPHMSLGAKFHATEDFFIEFNYGRSNVGRSSYENSQGQLISGDERDYSHYDFLLGFNVMSGEVFPFSTKSYLTSLYTVGGVGNTEFGGEESFTFIAGAGFRVAIDRGFVVSLEFKDHIYKSNLIKENEKTNNVVLAVGVGFLF